ncbi:MAG: hypothetical protein HC913_01155 [Microscillaceae bacterium]|nr:hypothetical protein [Microscillaceae bacterium]
MNHISETQLEDIVRQAQLQCQGSVIEWIETEQLFTEIYGDAYWKVKRKLLREVNLTSPSKSKVAIA